MNIGNRFLAPTFILALTLTACPGPSRECEFNSNCPVGRYCSAEGSCRADCTATAGCTGGQSCISFGMCIAASDAGAMDDAFTLLDDASIDAARVRTDVGLDVGPPDAFVPTEICTSSSAGAPAAADEDGDSAIDEGCGWYFGTPHPVGSIAARGMDVYETPRLSSDRLRLYVRGRFPGATPGVAPLVLTRPSASAPFGPARLLAYTPPASYVSSFHLSADELTMWAQVVGAGSMDLFRATRATTALPFGVLVPAVEVNSSANDIHPFLREDGLELLFVSARGGVSRIFRATRPTTGATFDAPTEIEIAVGPSAPADTGDSGPSLSQDGLTLFFGRDLAAGRRLYASRRASRDSPMFGVPEEVTSLNAAVGQTLFLAVYQDTQEAFFISDRAWTPGVGGSVWRARICRDAPCPPQGPPEAIACPSGFRSDDGLHCYSRPSDVVTGSEAFRNCLSLSGAHLVTVNSEAERQLVRRFTETAPAARVWIGLTDDGTLVPGATEDNWRWVSEEPFAFAAWATSSTGGFGAEPGGGTFENCVVQGPTHFGPLAGASYWADVECSRSFNYMCERELWPTW